MLYQGTAEMAAEQEGLWLLPQIIPSLNSEASLSILETGETIARLQDSIVSERNSTDIYLYIH